MSGANTREDYEAAALPERILIVHNTFVDHEHHITGSARALIANNLLVDARQIALKGQVGASLITRNLQWSGPDVTPNLAPDHGLPTGSAAIDAGLRQVQWLGTVWDLAPAAEIRGAGPDVGAAERWADSD